MNQPKAQPKTYSYVRFSTPEQAKGDSLRRQLEAVKQYAAEKGLELDETLTDSGVSAHHGLHRTKGALGSFLELVEQGQIQKGSHLFVENLDRLSRENPLDAFEQFRRIIKNGISIFTAQDRMEYSQKTLDESPNKLMTSIALMCRAHEESRTKSIRVSGGWTKKKKLAQEGKVKVTGRCPAWLTLSRDGKEFVPIRERAAVIRRIFEMKRAGKGSLRIVKELNDLDVWKPKGTRKKKGTTEQVVVQGWRKSYVQKILCNRAVIGEYQPHKIIDGKRQPDPDSCVLPTYFPAVVKRELFDQVQALIKRNRDKRGHGGGKTGKINNLFGHLAVCRNCGAPMAFVDKGPKPKGGQYLQCDSARRNLGCNNPMIRYDKVESAILRFCKGLDAASIIPGEDQRLNQVSILRNQVGAIEGRMSQLEKQYESIFPSFEKPNLSPLLRADLEKRLAANLANRENLKRDRSKLIAEINHIDHAGQETREQLKSVRELIRRMGAMKDEERISVRLNLRNQLRGLLTKIRIFTKNQHAALFFQTGERRLVNIEMGKHLLYGYPPKHFPEGPPKKPRQQSISMK